MNFIIFFLKFEKTPYFCKKYTILEENQIHQSVIETSFDEAAFLHALEKCEKEIFSFYIIDLLYQKIKTERELKSIFQIADYKYESPNDTAEVLLKSRIIDILSEFYFGSDDKTDSIKAFELVYQKYHPLKDNSFFNSPQIVGEFIFNIVETKNHQSVYDPFCGLGGFLLEAYKKNTTLNLIGGDIGIHNATFAQQRLIVHSISPEKIVMSHYNFFRQENIERDILITDPGFSIFFTGALYLPTPKSKNREFPTIKKCFENLKENGQLAIVLPDSVLIPQARQKDGIYKDNYAEARQFLEKQAEINLIVSLPETTYYNLGSTHKRSIVFFTKKKNPAPYQVYLAANKFGSKGVSEKVIKAFLDEIAIQYQQKTLPYVGSEDLTSWSADRLLAFKNDLFKSDLPKVKLRDIVVSVNKNRIKPTQNAYYYQASIRKNGKIEFEEKIYSSSSNHSFVCLEKGQIVVSGSNLHNGGIVVFNKDINNAIVSDHFYVLDIGDNDVLGEYLVALFNQDLMKQYVTKITKGNTNSRISILDLLEIEIPLSLLEQPEFVDNVKKSIILEEEIKAIQEENNKAIYQLFNSK